MEGRGLPSSLCLEVTKGGRRRHQNGKLNKEWDRRKNLSVEMEEPPVDNDEENDDEDDEMLNNDDDDFHAMV